MEGFYLASSNLAEFLEYGSIDSLLCADFQLVTTERAKLGDGLPAAEHSARGANNAVGGLPSPKIRDNVSRLADPSYLAFRTFSVMLEHANNANVFPAIHTSLAFLWCLSYTATGMRCLESVVPWNGIATFLNTIIQPSLDEIDVNLIEGTHFPVSYQTRWLPEDFLIRGQLWSRIYYPPSFFQNCPSDEDGRYIEQESFDIFRKYRCLWLGIRLAKFNRWVAYDHASRQFSTIPFAGESGSRMPAKQT